MAMKINELMIGDWVYNKHHKKNIQIQPYDFFVHGHGNNGTFAVSSTIVSGRDLVPIPLTEEILVKNGFKKQEDVNEWSYYKSKDGKGQYMILWSMDYNYLEIGSYTEEFGEFNRLGVMRYVHQLQHALRLCGIDKEIKL
jgi:hypothetical protein